MRCAVRHGAVVAGREDAAGGGVVFGGPEGEAAAQVVEVFVVLFVDLSRVSIWRV